MDKGTVVCMLEPNNLMSEVRCASISTVKDGNGKSVFVVQYSMVSFSANKFSPSMSDLKKYKYFTQACEAIKDWVTTPD